MDEDISGQPEIGRREGVRDDIQHPEFSRIRSIFSLKARNDFRHYITPYILYSFQIYAFHPVKIAAWRVEQ